VMTFIQNCTRMAITVNLLSCIREYVSRTAVDPLDGLD
jgi:hypothetical protein